MDVPDCPALPIYSSFPTCWVGLTFGLQSCCQRDLWLICFRKLRFCSASLYWLACRSRTRENCSIAWHRKKLWSVVNIYPVSPVSIGPKVGILNWRAILHETKCCRIDRVMSCPDHRCGACCLVPRQWLGNHPTTKILSIDVNCQFQGNLCQDPTCKPKTLRLIVLVILRKQEILQPWADEFPHKDLQATKPLYKCNMDIHHRVIGDQWNSSHTFVLLESIDKAEKLLMDNLLCSGPFTSCNESQLSNRFLDPVGRVLKHRRLG